MSPLVKTILEKRGIVGEAALGAFLQPDYENGRHDPFLLKDMDKAVARIAQAIKAGEKITIYGDYDIDGLSATALLLDALAQMGAQVDAYIPDRFSEGYGLNAAALKKLAKVGSQLVITVDCGSTSIEPVAAAGKAGLDVIITDHHEVGDQLPKAVAVINPKRPDSKYPFTDLAGVGVAFKLVCALQQQLELLPAGQEKWLLDLVALGTVCDVVTLVDENRVLVHWGLKVLATSRRPGLVALAGVAGIRPGQINARDLGFGLGPRLNAAGRLEHASASLELLTTTDSDVAIASAEALDVLNSERRRQQDEIFDEALEQAAQYAAGPVLVLAAEEWNHGIVGIVAAKLVERFAKPTLILQIMGKEAKGSARAAGDFNMVAALRSADDLLGKYGGHQAAAGCTLETTSIAKLRQRLNEYFAKMHPRGLQFENTVDMELADLTSATLDICDELEQLAPFGRGNPQPVFRSSLRVISHRPVGTKSQHLKLGLSDSQRNIEAIGFGLARQAADLGDSATFQFELGRNDFNGRSSCQLMIKNIEI